MSFSYSAYRRNYKFTRKDGTVVEKTSPRFTIEIRENGKFYDREKGPRDRKAAETRGTQWVRELERGEVGLVDPFKPHRNTPLTSHLQDWLSELRTAGRSAKYVSNCDRRMNKLFTDCGWKVLGDIEPNGFMRWRTEVQKTWRIGMRKGATGASASTLNQYLDTANAFLRWCVRPGRRIAANPLADVDKVRGSKVRLRRALTDEEVGRLLAAAPADRVIVYRVALSVGLRRAELRALKWGDLHLSALPPYAQLRAEATKAKRGDRVYFPPTLAADLGKTRPADAGDEDPVFTRVPSLVWWKIDLAVAGITYMDKMARQVDFHAGTRKTLCTRMHRENVPLGRAMLTMRHTDARLTMVDYLDGQHFAGDVLPEVSVPAPAASGAATVAG
jgi:integrase